MYSTSKCSYIPYMWQYSSGGSVNGVNGYLDCNRLYGDVVTLKVTKYYPVPIIRIGSIVVVLNNIKVPSTMEYRKKLAEKNGISGYTGLYEQKVKMIVLFKEETLQKV